MKGISRIDSRNTHAWFVRVYRDGTIHSKTFSDGVYGSKKKALEEACKYKEEYERQHPPADVPARVRLKPPSNNTSGVVGVSDTYDRSRNGKIMPCFSVTWRPETNKTRCKKFYYHNYDSREAAFEAAVRFRKDREREILNETNVDKPSKHNDASPLQQMLANLKSRPFR